MMADLDRIELMIGLSNNLRKENAEWRKEVYREGQERAKRVRDLKARFELEYAELDAEDTLMARYLPREQQEPMPRIVQQGPRQQEQIPRAVAAAGREPKN